MPDKETVTRKPKLVLVYWCLLQAVDKKLASFRWVVIVTGQRFVHFLTLHCYKYNNGYQSSVHCDHIININNQLCYWPTEWLFKFKNQSFICWKWYNFTLCCLFWGLSSNVYAGYPFCVINARNISPKTWAFLS